MARRNAARRRVVAGQVRPAVIGDVAAAVGQRLAHPLHPALRRIVIGDDIQPRLAHGRAVDEDHAAPHLNRIAGQAHDPLDPDLFGIARQAEHHHVAASRLRPHQPSRPDR